MLKLCVVIKKDLILHTADVCWNENSMNIFVAVGDGMKVEGEHIFKLSLLLLMIFGMLNKSLFS